MEDEPSPAWPVGDGFGNRTRPKPNSRPSRREKGGWEEEKKEEEKEQEEEDEEEELNSEARGRNALFRSLPPSPLGTHLSLPGDVTLA